VVKIIGRWFPEPIRLENLRNLPEKCPLVDDVIDDIHSQLAGGSNRIQCVEPFQLLTHLAHVIITGGGDAALFVVGNVVDLYVCFSPHEDARLLPKLAQPSQSHVGLGTRVSVVVRCR